VVQGAEEGDGDVGDGAGEREGGGSLGRRSGWWRSRMRSRSRSRSRMRMRSRGRMRMRMRMRSRSRMRMLMLSRRWARMRGRGRLGLRRLARFLLLGLFGFGLAAALAAGFAATAATAVVAFLLDLGEERAVFVGALRVHHFLGGRRAHAAAGDLVGVLGGEG